MSLSLVNALLNLLSYLRRAMQFYTSHCARGLLHHGCRGGTHAPAEMGFVPLRFAPRHGRSDAISSS